MPREWWRPSGRSPTTFPIARPDGRRGRAVARARQWIVISGCDLPASLRIGHPVGPTPYGLDWHWPRLPPECIVRPRAEAPMSCCDETTARVPTTDLSRRAMFKGAALVASVVPAARPALSAAEGNPIKLAYCSQLLCGVPYEVARSAGPFKNHGLDVQL